MWDSQCIAALIQDQSGFGFQDLLLLVFILDIRSLQDRWAFVASSLGPQNFSPKHVSNDRCGPIAHGILVIMAKPRFPLHVGAETHDWIPAFAGMTESGPCFNETANGLWRSRHPTHRTTTSPSGTMPQ